LNYKVLRQSVISLYMADEIRRVFCESVLPYLTQNKSKLGKDLKILTLKMQQSKT